MRAALVASVVGAALVAPQPTSAAIVGGEPAEPGEWPWQVLLVVDGEWWCGGSILDVELVVTAAHCTEGLAASDIVVEAGSIRAGAADAQRAGVDTIVAHEGYDGVTLEHDIALLRLAHPLVPSELVAPVTLPDPRTEDDVTGTGDPVVVTGFGFVDEDGPQMSRLLREAEVEIIADATCASDYDGPDDVTADLMVCAGFQAGGADACFGDSGGPLVAPADADRSAWFLVGIVSWGEGCGRPRSPTVYTEIGPHLDWLAEHGAADVVGDRFESDTGARIPALGTQGKARPYPLEIDVAAFDGELSRIAVELVGLTHARTADLDIWLQAPDGTVVTLLSDVGGEGAITDATVLIDATGPPAGASPFGVRVSPSNRQPDRQRKGAPPPADLSDLLGLDPNGEWQLLVADDRPGATGRLDAWALVLG